MCSRAGRASDKLADAPSGTMLLALRLKVAGGLPLGSEVLLGATRFQHDDDDDPAGMLLLLPLEVDECDDEE